MTKYTTTTSTRRNMFGRKKQVVHHHRKPTMKDKISGALLKLKGSLTHRPGQKVRYTFTSTSSSSPAHHHRSHPMHAPLHTRMKYANTYHPTDDDGSDGGIITRRRPRHRLKLRKR